MADTVVAPDFLNCAHANPRFLVCGFLMLFWISGSSLGAQQNPQPNAQSNAEPIKVAPRAPNAGGRKIIVSGRVRALSLGKSNAFGGNESGVLISLSQSLSQN